MGYQKAIDYLNRLPAKGWEHNRCPRNDDVYDPARDRLFYKRRNGMRIMLSSKSQLKPKVQLTMLK